MAPLSHSSEHAVEDDRARPLETVAAVHNAAPLQWRRSEMPPVPQPSTNIPLKVESPRVADDVDTAFHAGEVDMPLPAGGPSYDGVSTVSRESAQHTRRDVLYVFLLFVTTDILLSVDSGALPVALSDITSYYKLSRFGQGTVGALSPAGFAVATTFVGVLLQRRSPRIMLIIGLAVTAISSLGFAAAPSSWVLYLSRAGYGIAYAVFFVFAPVWITMFAPQSRATSWISVIQAGAPIGAVVGMDCAGLVAGWGSSWRITFFLQALFIALCVGAFSFVPTRLIDGPDATDVEAQSRHQQYDVPSHNAAQSCNTSSASSNAPYRSHRPAKTHGQHAPHALSQTSSRISGRAREDAVAVSLSMRSHDFLPGKTAVAGANEFDDLDDHFRTPPDGSPSVGVDSPPSRATAPEMVLHDSSGGGSPRWNNSERIVLDRPLYRHIAGPSLALEPEALSSVLTPSFRQQMSILLNNRVFVHCSLAMGFLTFVVEGIRYWVVLYRTEVFGDDIGQVVAAFTIVSASAPILGMFLGGGLIDRCGGYRTKTGVAKSMRVLMGFSLCAGPSAAAVLLSDLGTKSSLRLFSCATWSLLFFGAAHVAPLTGIMIAVVPPSTRSLSSAVSLLVNHVIGFFFAPFGVGILASVQGIKLGFQSVISASALALAFAAFAWIAAEEDLREEQSASLTDIRRAPRAANGVDSVVAGEDHDSRRSLLQS